MPDSSKKARILICEDEIIIASDLESRLIELGYTVCGITTKAEKALELAEQHQPDLVMINIVLPGGMDGIEAAELIRTNWGIPVVFLTAETDSERLERTKLTCPFGYLLKPFHDRDLQITTEMALGMAALDAERRKAETALRTSEEKYYALFEQAADGILLIDPDNGELVEFNRKAHESLGYSSDEFNKLKISDFEFLETNEAIQMRMKQIASAGFDSFETKHRRKNGEIIDVLVNSKLIEIGGRQYFQSIFRDITAQKKTEGELRESEKRFRQVFENANDMIYRMSLLDGTYEYVSPASEKIFGYSPREFYESPILIQKIIHPDWNQYFEEQWANLQRGEMPPYYEYQVVHKSGEVKWINQRNVLVYNENKHPVYIEGVVTDITERKKAEKKIRENEFVLKNFFDNSIELMGIVELLADEPDIRFLKINKAAAHYAGRPPEYFEGRLASEIGMPEELVRLWAEQCRVSGCTGQPVKFEYQNRHTDGLHTFLASIATIRPSIFSFVVFDMTERKRMEEALKESEGKNRLLVDNAKDIIWIRDMEMRMTYVSPSVETVRGYTPEEAKKQKIDEVLTPESARLALETFTQILGKKEKSIQIPDEHTLELEHCCKDGRTIWMEVRMCFLEDNNKTPVGILGVSRDITTRKRAEEALRAERDLNERVMEISPAGITRVSAEGTVVYANKRAEEILGIQASLDDDRTYNDPAWKITGYRGEPFPEEQLPFNIVKETGQPVYGVQHAIEWPDGKRVFLSISGSPLFDSSGAFEGMVAVIDDITNRWMAEEALRESEQRHRSLFDSTIDGICLHEIVYQDDKPVDYIILEVNPQYESIIGINKDKAVGALASKLYNAEAPPYLEIYSRVVETGKPYSFETYFAPMDKHFIISVFTTGSQKFATVFQDITDLKKAEEEKDRLQNQLRQAHKLEAIGTLAGGISHDFNNILQAIHGYTQILLLDKDPKSQEYTNLKAIKQSSERAAQLIKQLLLFSRKAETERRPLNLNKEIEHARRILERTIPKMIDIVVHPGSRLWMVNADPVQVEQILLNLGSNAADSMPEGGQLVLTTQNIVIDSDYVHNRIEATSGDFVLLTVSDTGRGMSPETVDHIFEPFYTTKEIGKGTGLGLASVYGIVKGHGGFINCYSDPGQGTTFKIYLPAATQIEELDYSLPQSGLPPGGTETVLVVDDEAHIRDMATKMLSRFGYQVIIAKTGEEALEKFSSSPVQLVILDLGMPGMGGYKCLREILKKDQSAKILIASGYAINSQIKKTIESGAKGFIAKPYQLNDLLTRVRAVLDE